MEPLLSKFYLLVGWEPYTWLTIFMIATITDAALTVYSLSKGGREANPVMRLAMRFLPVPVALFFLKGLQAAMVFSSMQMNILYLPLIAILFTAICAWNTVVIIKQLRS